MQNMATGKRVAVIGSGISGLAAAWRLSQTHTVVLYEAALRLGGHANTRRVAIDGQSVSVDTGFIVFNPATYPNFIAMLDELGVESAPSDMSFSASLDQGGFEYSSNPQGLLAQKRNLLRPRMWRMVSDLTRLYSYSRARNPDLETLSLDAFLDSQGYSRSFKDDHVLPMCAAIWSSPAAQIGDYPARSFFDFFINHGLLQFTDRPLWRTIRGGSRNYVQAIARAFRGETRLGATVTSVTRTEAGVSVQTEGEAPDLFDDVVLACHSDQALRLLSAPTQDEAALLGDIAYQPNRAVLHTDTRFMPRRRAAWASWNYVAESADEISLTYWMNTLQPLDTDTPVLVTLNPGFEPDPDKVLAIDHYDHPVFNQAAVAAQNRIGDIQGRDRIWYCGAWMGSGFHEDGLQAGLAVAEALGAPVRAWGQEGCLDRIAWKPPVRTADDADALIAAE